MASLSSLGAVFPVHVSVMLWSYSSMEQKLTRSCGLGRHGRRRDVVAVDTQNGALSMRDGRGFAELATCDGRNLSHKIKSVQQMLLKCCYTARCSQQ